MSTARRRLLLVSNRLPLSFKTEDGKMSASPSSGGLVTALTPILEEHGGTWIGSPGAGSAGTEEEEQIRSLLKDADAKLTYHYVPVFLTSEEQQNFYEGFSNEVVWPLFHDLQSRCNFSPVYWEFYKRVNRKFADAVVESARKGDVVWIQDYQLMAVARELRPRMHATELAFFMHIPFPAPDIFEKLPWRQQILEALLEYDLIGLQTVRDQRNLIACLRAFVPEREIVSRGAGRVVKHKNRSTHIEAFPISIDFDSFAQAAGTAAVKERTDEIRGQLNNVHIALGVDRLDYTKGIPQRLRAFDGLLRNYPDLRGKISLYQVVVPSRESIMGYKDLMRELEGLVAHINGEYSIPGWHPVHYVHRSVPREELLALYRVAGTALVTPLKDGMNLVSKEFCAARTDNDGVLVLSEFAGAAPELGRGALLVNPYDEVGVADAIARSVAMQKAERTRRMVRMRGHIRKWDILKWRNDFFNALEEIADQGRTKGGSA